MCEKKLVMVIHSIIIRQSPYLSKGRFGFLNFICCCKKYRDEESISFQCVSINLQYEFPGAKLLGQRLNTPIIFVDDITLLPANFMFLSAMCAVPVTDAKQRRQLTLLYREVSLHVKHQDRELEESRSNITWEFPTSKPERLSDTPNSSQGIEYLQQKKPEGLRHLAQ